MSALDTFMIWGAPAGVILAVIAVLWRGFARKQSHMDRDDPDAIWLGQLGEGAGEDASIDRRIAANDASRRRAARKGERWLP